MKKGDIVRRILEDGTPIGPYLVYLCKEGNLWRRVISTAIMKKEGRNDKEPYKNFPTLLRKEHVIEIKMARLQIIDTVYRRIESGKQTKIIHPPTANWVKLLENSAEIVQIRNFQFIDDKMVFKIDSVEKLQGRDSDIQLVLGYRIL